MLVASSVGFAGMGLVSRLIPPAISSSEKVFFRSFLGLGLMLAAYRALRIRIGRPVNVTGLVARGVYGGVALLCYFHAMDTVGLAKGTLYCYTYPIFAAVLGWFTGGERPDRRALAALGAASFGAFLTLGGDGWKPSLTLGDAAGLLSGALSGAAVLSIRKLHRTDTSAWIVIAFTGLSSVFAVPVMAAHFVVPTGALLVANLFALAAIAVASQLLMTAGYRHVSAVEGGVLSLCAVPASAVLGFLILGERQQPRFWVGAAIVFAVAVFLNARSAPPDDAEPA